MTFSTLITAHVRTDRVLDFALQAIRSHHDTCDSELHVWDHEALLNTPQINNRLLVEACTDVGAHYFYTDELYNQSKWWNKFRAEATTDYVVLASADVVFHPGWLNEIERMIKKHPGCLGYHPVTTSKYERGQSYISDSSQLRPDEVWITANPLCHVIVTATHGGHTWDEQFPYWEGDMDYHLTMERGTLKACICRGSWVDHRAGSEFRDSGTPIQGAVDARRRLEAKWNLPRIEY